ncbi:MAG: class I SAM-dependent methyltransferase [Patescibacteria group bacterium]
MAVGVALLAFDVYVVWNLLNGAPYVPSKKGAVDRMAKCANAGPGKKCADIGSGDGRIVVAMAQAGAEAHGYENNPLLVWWSRAKIKRLGLQDRAFIHRENFWKSDFSQFDAVTLFGISHIMKRLWSKLQSELKPGALIVSNAFTFPGTEPIAKDDGIFVYAKN